MTENKRETVILAYINDLIFETKIRSTSQSLGHAAVIAKKYEDFLDALGCTQPSVVVIDLNSAAGKASAAIAGALEHPGNPRIVAFVSHVDRDLAEQARNAGAHVVLPRSAFAAELPMWLTGAP